MSALGQKQTCKKGMSALPPKADMCGATRDVHFGPIADIGIYATRTGSQWRKGVTQRDIRNHHQTVEWLVQL